MSVTTTVDKRVSVAVEIGAPALPLRLEFRLEWREGQSRLTVDFPLVNEGTPPQQYSGMQAWPLGEGGEAIAAIRSLQAACAELLRHLTPDGREAMAPDGREAMAPVNGQVVATLAAGTTGPAEVVPLAMPPDRLDALAARWAQARVPVEPSVVGDPE